MRGYYFITDESLSLAGNLSDVRNAVEAGAACIQYRNKTGSTLNMLNEAKELKKICRGVPLLINDRLDIALAVNAEGVHIGQDDMPFEIARRLLGPDKIIGVTAHDLEEALEAERIGANYLGVSPVFSTSTKKDAGAPCGVRMISRLKAECKIPLVAVGGITFENAPEVIRAGADSLCAISAVVAGEDVFDEVKKFNALFE